MIRKALAAAAVIAMTLPAAAHDLGLAGLLSKKNSADLEPLTISSEKPLGADWTLKSGMYYEVEIEADGSAELQLDGAEFFRAIWVDEIVVEGLEIRPLGVDSVDFDEAGEMEIGFVAIKPGSYYLKVTGSTGETQRLEITIK